MPKIEEKERKAQQRKQEALDKKKAEEEAKLAEQQKLEEEKRPITAESMAEFLKSAKIKGITGKEIFLAGSKMQDANAEDR